MHGARAPGLIFFLLFFKWKWGLEGEEVGGGGRTGGGGGGRRGKGGGR